MRSHLMNDCLNVMQICSVCEGKEVTSKIGDHNCIYTLKAKLRQKDEELAKKILIKDFEYFMDRRVILTADPISNAFLTNLTGTEWKQMRSLLSGVFTSGKLKLMAEHIDKVGKNFEKYTSLQADEGNEIDMKVVGGLMTLDAGLLASLFRHCRQPGDGSRANGIPAGDLATI